MTADGRRGEAAQGSTSLAGESMQFEIGAEVFCRDGSCGKVARVVIDPIARTLTHIVVERRHARGLGRLVPTDLVDTSGQQVRLSCTLAEFDRLDDAEDVQFLPSGSEDWGYGSAQALEWPYYALGTAGTPVGLGLAGADIGATPIGHESRPILSDRVPLREVEVRRGDTVLASDGEIGSVQGLVIDLKDHHVTHVLLQEGHLWSRKQIAIPITTVTRSAGIIHVGLTLGEIRDLPPVHLNSGR